MNKAVVWIFRILLVIIAVCLMAVEVYPRVLNKAKKTEVSGSEEWMSKVEGNLLLSQISIPGVHDAATRNVQLPLFTKCQDMTTTQMLESGFRYLDIRLGIAKSGDEKTLQLYHSVAHCLKGITPFGGKLELQDIIDECTEFLEEHPTETIIFVVKQEHGDESKAEFARVLKNYTTGDKWLLTDEMPTLDEARGKIVLFRRYQDMADLGKEAGIYLTWSQQNDSKDTSKTTEKVKCDSTYLAVQDRFKYDKDDKWTAFVKTIKESPKLVEEGSVVINFLSTSGSGVVGNPYSYAKTLNEKFLNMNLTGDVGWVIIDFGNATLAEHIYQQNFE